MKEFTISSGTIRIEKYPGNIDILYWKNGNNEEYDFIYHIYSDACNDFTLKENLDDIIEAMEDYDDYITIEDFLNYDDIKKLREELTDYVYPWSLDSK